MAMVHRAVQRATAAGLRLPTRTGPIPRPWLPQHARVGSPSPTRRWQSTTDDPLRQRLSELTVNDSVTEPPQWRRMSMPDNKAHSVLNSEYVLYLLNKSKKEIMSAQHLWWRYACRCKHCVVPSGPEKGKRTFTLAQMPENPELLDAFVRPSDGYVVLQWKDDFLRGEKVHTTELSPTFVNIWQRHRGPYSLLTERVLWDAALMKRELQTVRAWEEQQRFDIEKGSARQMVTAPLHSTRSETNDADWEIDAHMELERTGIVKIDTKAVLEKLRGKGMRMTAEDLPAILDYMGMRESVNLPHVARIEEERSTSQAAPFAEHVQARAYPGVGLHTGHAYLADAPAIGVAFCVSNDVQSGGGSLTFSDGYRALFELELTDEDAYYDLMSTRTVHAGYGLSWASRYFRMSYDAVEWLRWDPFRRQLPYREVIRDVDPNSIVTMLGLEESMMRRRRTEMAFQRRLASPQHVFQLDLQPGDLVLWNNRRVLHGARAYTLAPGANSKRHIMKGWIPWQTHKRVLDSVTTAYKPGVPAKMGTSVYAVGRSDRMQVADALGVPAERLAEVAERLSEDAIRKRNVAVQALHEAGVPWAEAVTFVNEKQRQPSRDPSNPAARPPFPPGEDVGRSGEM